jgi:hypothetical protein
LSFSASDIPSNVSTQSPQQNPIVFPFHVREFLAVLEPAAKSCPPIGHMVLIVATLAVEAGAAAAAGFSSFVSEAQPPRTLAPKSPTAAARQTLLMNRMVSLLSPAGTAPRRVPILHSRPRGSVPDMTESYRALCSDFYINQKLSVKLDLPRERQTILDLCDRVRRQFPVMSQFRRYRDELALETPPTCPENRWVAIRSNNIRSGVVSPQRPEQAYDLHRHVLEIAPYFLSISPLDVDYLELLYGFDLPAERNHDAIVFDALIAGSPAGRIVDIPGAVVTDCQPLLGVTLRDQAGGDIEVGLEVKTRAGSREARAEDGREPISVYLTLRRFGPVADVKDLPGTLALLARHGESIVSSRVVPDIIVPIRDAMGSGSH